MGRIQKQRGYFWEVAPLYLNVNKILMFLLKVGAMKQDYCVFYNTCWPRNTSLS